MGKYLVLWEVVPGTVPLNAKEAGPAFLALTDMVKADMKKGQCKDWGTFLGAAKGYSIDEGTEVEVMNGMLQYSPFIKFEVHAVASVDQVAQAMKAWGK
jgi:hypothetical protein